MVCSLLCSLNIFPKYLILAVELKKKTTMQSNNAVVSGSIADCSNFMSDCKQMQVRLKNGITTPRRFKCVFQKWLIPLDVVA